MESNNDLKLLESTFELYSKYLLEMCAADDGKIFPVDLFFISNIQRSQFLIQGFLLLVKEKNFFSAAPLIRLHLDNLLHIYAVFIHPKPHELVTNLTRGASSGGRVFLRRPGLRGKRKGTHSVPFLLFPLWSTLRESTASGLL